MEAIKKKITFKKLLELNSAIMVLNYQKKNRFSLALWQMQEYMKYPFEQYNKRVNLINQEFASVDKDENFFLDENKNPIYTKFNKKNSGERDLEYAKLIEETVEIEVKYCKDLKPIKELQIPFIKAFNGFLFEATDEEIENWVVEAEKEEIKEEVKK